MSRARRSFLLAATALCFASLGCNSLDSVSKFCTTSNTTLTSALPVFDDLEASCNRAESVQKGFGSFIPSDPPDPSCVAIGKQAAGAEAAVTVLSAYFTALNSLATFGTKDTATSSQNLAKQVTAAANGGVDAQAAIGSLALFLDTAIEGSYQQKVLSQDITATSKSIGQITDALVKIIQENYLKQLLGDEESNYQDAYKKFKTTNTDGMVTLMVDDRWNAEEKSLADKRAAANALITALNTIKTCSQTLAEHANKLKEKELPGILSPYITQLETLIPQIQKAF